MFRRPTAFATPLGLLGLLLTIVSAPARAQQPPVEQPFVRVAAVSPWMDATHPLSVTLQLGNPTEVAFEQVAVRVSVFAAVGSRSELRQALDDRPPTQLVAAVTQEIAGELAPGEQRTVTVERDVRALSPSIGRTGVYPIELAVRHARDEVRLLTAVPFVASAPQARLNVTWILPVQRPIVTRPDGVYDPAGLETLGMEELTQQAQAIAARPGSPVTLAPSPSLLDTVSDLADGFAQREGDEVTALSDTSPPARQAAQLLEALRRAARSAGEVATAPYAPADFPSLARRGLQADLLRQVTLGRTVVESRLGRAPALSVLMAPGGAIDGPSATALATLGASGIVADQASLPPLPAGPFTPDLRPTLFGPSRPVGVRADGAGPTALLPDAPIGQRLEAPDQGVLLAQALVAETASGWLEIPLNAADRVLVLSSRRLPTPPALGAALDGLARAPWVRMRTASDALAALPPQGDPLVLPRLSRPDRPYLAAARAAREDLGVLRRIAVDTLPQEESLDRLILLAESAEWESEREAGAALARAVSANVRRAIKGLRVEARQVTLTSRDGSIPVTVVNENPFPVRLLVRLDSAKVSFPDGASRTVELPSRDTTVDFRVRVRATGSFPVDIRLETPDGTSLLAAGRVTLRSTAVSAVALAVIGGSGLFLLLAWFRRAARRRKIAATG